MSLNIQIPLKIWTYIQLRHQATQPTQIEKLWTYVEVDVLGN